MREYELTMVVHPELDENAFNEAVNRVKSWIGEGGGEVVKVDLWGKRKLAYPIRKLNEGQYVMMQVNMPAALVTTLERNLRFLEPVLRYLVVVKE